MGDTTSPQVSTDVDAILAGMRRPPPAVDPNYRPPLPPQIQPRSAPASAFGPGAFGSAQPQSWPAPAGSYGNAPAPPPPRTAGQDAASGLTPSIYTNQPPSPAVQPVPTQVAANRPVAVPLTPQQTAPPGIDQANFKDPTGRNNPGNIRTIGGRGPAGFQSYPTMQAGLQALQNQLLIYQDQYGLNTIRGIISRYSPPNENPTDQAVQAAAARMGISPDQRIDVHDPATMTRLTNAILAQEQGGARGQGPGGMNLPQPQQQMLPPQPRDAQDWGSAPPRDFGPGPGGQQSPRNTIAHVMGAFAPLLVGIASLALRLPLSTAITAYGAMARAQDLGQREDYERNRTRYQDQLKEATAQQTMESRDASDAFAEYGNNNPQGLQQTLAQIALKYNDPIMYRMAEQGDLNGIHNLQTRRDMLNQGLLKGSKAAQDEQDRQAENAAVAAMDRQWHDDFVAKNGREPTADEAAIEHNKNIGEASRAGTKTDTTDAEEAAIYNVLGPDKQPTGQQVRAGKNGGLFDVGTKQPVQLKPGETIAPETRGTAGGGLEATKPYDVVDKDGKVVRTVLGRERKDQPGILDSETGDPIKLEPGQSLQPHARSSVASPLETGKPFDIVDKDGHVVPGGQGVMLRERRDGAGYVYAETGDPLKLEPGQHVRQITPTTSGGGRAGAQVLRQLVGGREVLSDLQNVVRLPVGTTIGPLGTVHQGPTIMDALRGDLTRKLTDQDSQLMQASMASMSRELSILMSPVYGGNWAAQQIDPLIPKSGDTIQTVVFKLARLAQSADNALEAASKSPILSNEEQEYAKDLRRQISEAIPWSTAEAMDFTYRGHPKESFGDYVQRQGIHDQPGQPSSGLPPGVTVEVK